MTEQSSRDVVQWVFLTGNRLSVAILVLLLLSGIGGLVSAGLVLDNRAPLYYLLSSLVAGNITLITVVVSINQLVLSRDFGAPGELQTEIRETLTFHRRATNGSSVPLEPPSFLRASITELDQYAERLTTVAPDEPPLHRSLLTLRRELQHHTESVTDRLSAGENRLLTVVIAVLSVRYLDYIREIRALQARHTGQLSDETDDLLAEIVVELESLDIARYYFLSMFVQQELSRLSRMLVYTGLPAIALAGGTLVHLAQYEPETAMAAESVAVVIGTGLVGLFPIALLASYVLRISTIAQYISITPFDSP